MTSARRTRPRSSSGPMSAVRPGGADEREAARGAEGVHQLAARARAVLVHDRHADVVHVPGDGVAEEDEQQRPGSRKARIRLRGSRRSWSTSLRAMARSRVRSHGGLSPPARRPRRAPARRTRPRARARPPAIPWTAMPRAASSAAAAPARAALGVAHRRRARRGRTARPRSRPRRPASASTALRAVVGRDLEQRRRHRGAQRGRAVERDDAAAVHEREAVAVLGLLHVVRAHEHRGAAARPARRSGPRSRGARSGPRPRWARRGRAPAARAAPRVPSARRCFQPSESSGSGGRGGPVRPAISSTQSRRSARRARGTP